MSTRAKPSSLKKWAFVVGIAPLAYAMVVASGCASVPDETRFTRLQVPDRTQFQTAGVSSFLERRCGTLDCHGQSSRALRIYGQFGLRSPTSLDAAVTSNSSPTTDQEYASNFQSVVSLEPEELTRVVANKGVGAGRLLLILKALGYEPGKNEEGVQHKGGSLIKQATNDYGYIGLVSWLEGSADAVACGKSQRSY